MRFGYNGPAMLVACLTLFALSFATLLVAVRGRRVDDHPLCRRCGYDQTGRPAEATTCAECGADLTGGRAVRVGHRVRRGRLAAAALAIGLPAAAAAVWAGSRDLADVDWLDYAPNFWLRHRVLTGDPPAADVFHEVTHRTVVGDLPAADVDAVVDRVLALQADPKATWQPAWGEYVEAARELHKVDDGRWSRFRAEAVRACVDLPPTLTAGRPAKVAVTTAGQRVGRDVVGVGLDWSAVRVDGGFVGTGDPTRPYPRPAPSPAYAYAPEVPVLVATLQLYHDPGPPPSGDFGLPAEVVAAVGPGTHQITVTVACGGPGCVWTHGLYPSSAFDGLPPLAIRRTVVVAGTPDPLAPGPGYFAARGATLLAVRRLPDGRVGDLAWHWRGPTLPGVRITLSVRDAMDGTERPVALTPDDPPGTPAEYYLPLHAGGYGSAAGLGDRYGFSVVARVVSPPPAAGQKAVAVVVPLAER